MELLTTAQEEKDISGRFIHCESSSHIFTLETGPQDQSPVADILIITPFGKSVHDLFIPSYYLQANGFNVIRFDPRNHVGMSTGEIERFTLSQLERDTMEVLRSREPDPKRPVILLGISLSAPVAWKLAAFDQSFAGVVTLVGVVDVPDTVQKAGQLSLAPYRDPHGTGPKYDEIFGFNILGQQFVDDMDSNAYGSFADTLEHVRSIKTLPVHAIAAANDEYVDFAQAQELAGELPGDSRFIVMENASHELGRGIAATKRAVLLIAQLGFLILGLEDRSEELIVPKFTDLIKDSSLESDYLSRFEAEFPQGE